MRRSARWTAAAAGHPVELRRSPGETVRTRGNPAGASAVVGRGTAVRRHGRPGPGAAAALHVRTGASRAI